MSVQVESIIRLTPSIRRKATANVWARKEETFDMDYLYETLNTIVEDSSCEANDKPMFERLRKVDLTRFVKESPGINRFFTCTFFSRRFAWISKNEEGEFRYFSKIKEGHGYYSFDLFDLLTIVMNMTSRELVKHLETSYPFQSASRWAMEQKEKLNENRVLLKPVHLMERPNLQRVLRGGIEVLEAFLSFGEENINGKHLSDGKHSVFFLSTQYFKERFFPLKSVSTLNQWVNLFAVLGLVEKTTNVPLELQIEAEKQQTLKKKHNHVSFYIIPSFQKVFEQAEVRAKELVLHRISYHQLTKNLVLSIFGKAVHDHVYVQKTHGRRRKEKPNAERLSLDWLDMYFRIQLDERGVVSKKELEESTAVGKHAFSKLWNQLVQKHGCEVSPATKEEVEKFGFRHRQTIARVNRPVVSSTVWKSPDSLPWDVIDEGEPLNTLTPLRPTDNRLSWSEVS